MSDDWRKKYREATKTVKAALVEAGYPRPDLSVTRGKGTSYGWIDIRLIIDRPGNCYCLDRERVQADGHYIDEYTECRFCREQRGELARDATEIAIKSGAALGTYTDDMGYKHFELLTHVNYRMQPPHYESNGYKHTTHEQEGEQ